jgi:transposase
LRDLLRYRTKLTGFASSEKNRSQHCLTVSNIQIASVVSDIFGKSSMRIIKSLLEGPRNDLYIEPLLCESMVKKGR